MLFVMLLQKSHTCGKPRSWGMDQNALNQSDCRILKSTTSLKNLIKYLDFFGCWYKIMGI